MFQLDNKFLEDIGLGGMPDDQKQAFLQHLYEELELRVGTRLSEGMTDEQLAEFEKLIDANDQQGALKWLETNRPNYKQVVAEELEKLRQEIIANKDRIIADMQIQADQTQPPASDDDDVVVGDNNNPVSPYGPQPPVVQPGSGTQQPGQDPTELQIR